MFLFSTLDASSGFWQLLVDEVSSKLLTFNTPWGSYRFCKLPFGVAPAPEIYQKEMERLFEGVPVEIIVDDFLIHAHDREEMDEKLTMALERSREAGLKFNPDKLKLRVDKVNYMLDIHLLRRAYSQIQRRSGQLLTCLHQVTKNEFSDY